MKKKAFTLIELMAYIGILSIIIYISYKIFYPSFKLYLKYNTKASLQQESMMFFNHIQNDLAQTKSETLNFYPLWAPSLNYLETPETDKVRGISFKKLKLDFNKISGFTRIGQKYEIDYQDYFILYYFCTKKRVLAKNTYKQSSIRLLNNQLLNQLTTFCTNNNFKVIFSKNVQNFYIRDSSLTDENITFPLIIYLKLKKYDAFKETNTFTSSISITFDNEKSINP